MASQTRTSGGVRNLRAMFENREETSTSPPDRGRSPAESIGEGTNGVSPQPLSKVRTSFVAVERSGGMSSQPGPKMQTNGESSTVNEQPGLGTNEKLEVKAPTKKEPTNKVPINLEARKKAATNGVKTDHEPKQNNSSTSEPTPGAATKTISKDVEKKLGDVKGKGKARETESLDDQYKNIVTGEQPSTSTPLENPKTKGVVVPNGVSSGEKVKSQPSTDTIEKTMAPKTSTKQPAPLNTTKTPAASKISPKVPMPHSGPKSPILHSKPSTAGKATDHGTSKPSTSTQVKYPVKQKETHTEKTPVKSPITGKPNAHASTSQSTSTSNPKQTHSHTSPSVSHKTQPKSPTRTAKLPPSMTAPTASSLSKISSPPTISHRRSMGSVSVATGSKTLSRSPSRTSISASMELRRKASVIDKNRPALGRPPAPKLRDQPSRQSLPGKSTLPDESFLARMMRPTASSASKMHEKIVTPPKPKPASRPLTQDGAASRSLTDAHRGSPVSKRLTTGAHAAKAVKSVAEKSDALGTKAIQPTSESSSSAVASQSTTKPVEVMPNGNSTEGSLAAVKTGTAKPSSELAEKSTLSSKSHPTTPQKLNEKNDVTTTGPVSPEIKLSNGETVISDASSPKPNTSDMSNVVPLLTEDVVQSDNGDPATIKVALAGSKNDQQISNGAAVVSTRQDI